ncbi:hypothetical protein BS47DRAFT_1185136 [Hydnum rufescens UP504]|uniref:Uncharacterized protein n=1 Tax=Hydnum rufescens UP504 TaxID=1448309 RepID=A0A9P6DV72_9AGAM|nr:hypothetical protein BS47DRAFT_1185136 [Hydnum rufescens UP504]
MIRLTCSLPRVLRIMSVPARPAWLCTRAAYQSRAEHVNRGAVVLNQALGSLANPPSARKIFNAVVGYVAQNHPERFSNLNARNAFYAHVVMNLLPFVLAKRYWVRLIVLYMNHTQIQNVTVTERDPLLLLLLNLISGGSSNLTSQDKAQRISKFRTLMKPRDIRLSINALHAVCFAGDLSGARVFLDDALEICGSISNRPVQLEVAQRVYAHLIGISFARRKYSVVLRLSQEMKQLNLAPNSAHTYGHIIRSLCLETMFVVQGNPNDHAIPSMEQSIQSIQSLLDKMIQAQIPVTPRLLAILIREFSAMMQYLAKYRLSIDLARDFFIALTTIRKTDDEVGSIAMLEFAWAEVLLDIREFQKEDGRPNRFLPYIDSSTGCWSYDAVLHRIVRRSWLSRRGRSGHSRKTPHYYGRGISTVVIESHRLQILARDRLLSNDPSTALEHYKALRDLTDGFHMSSERFLSSVPLSSRPAPLPSLNGIISSPDKLISSTTRDVALRLHGTYARLLNHALGKRPPASEQVASAYVLLVEVLRQGAPMRKRSFSNFHRAWRYTMTAIMTWRLPWDATGSRLGIRAAFDILNYAFSNGLSGGDGDARTQDMERAVIRDILAGNVAWHVARVALRWAQEQEVARLEWRQSVSVLVTTFQLFDISFTTAELLKLEVDANWDPHGRRRLGMRVKSGLPAREVFKDVMAKCQGP